ncbi:MAG: PAS domain-containing sensor histidine kinase, partial [Candidatus Eremiobacterota bacterium]
MLTEFAPPERAEMEDVLEQNMSLKEHALIKTLLDSSPDMILVLNKHRQIVLANDKFLKFLHLNDEKNIVGERPGEAMGCIHKSEGPGGCGTSKFCKYCGAAHAIVNTITKNETDLQECRININDETGITALTLRVWTTPFNINDATYVLFCVRDVSDEKYRHILERIFFHDILNLAGGLQGIMELMPDLTEEEARDFYKEGLTLSRQLIGEIESQRSLLQAERGDLHVNITEIFVPEFLSAICTLYRNHPVAENKIMPDPNIKGEHSIDTDQVLLSRVIGNLIKNALEASEPGQKVTVSYTNDKKNIVFSIYNEKEMPEEVKMQIFNRSFSTKASAGRGLGTYSVKLLTERYLKGKVDFTSTEEGT